MCLFGVQWYSLVCKGKFGGLGVPSDSPRVTLYGTDNCFVDLRLLLGVCVYVWGYKGYFWGFKGEQDLLGSSYTIDLAIVLKL